MGKIRGKGGHIHQNYPYEFYTNLLEKPKKKFLYQYICINPMFVTEYLKNLMKSSW